MTDILQIRDDQDRRPNVVSRIDVRKMDRQRKVFENRLWAFGVAAVVAVVGLTLATPNRGAPKVSHPNDVVKELRWDAKVQRYFFVNTDGKKTIWGLARDIRDPREDPYEIVRLIEDEMRRDGEPLPLEMTERVDFPNQFNVRIAEAYEDSHGG